MAWVCSAVSAEPNTSLAKVITGMPTAPKPVATLLPMSDTSAEKRGLKPKPIKMAAGIATAVPKPAMPSNRPPKPHTISST